MLVLAFSYPAFAQDNKLTEGSLQAQFANLLEKEGLAGVSWFVIRGDEVSIDGRGFADLETKAPMKAETPVHIGSVAKVVLAIGVLRLIETSELTLDSKVTEVLSDKILENSRQHQSPVRVRHLLEHTAGLNNLNMWQFLNTRPTPNTPLREGLLPDADSRLKVRTEPGTQYSYSNIGYAMLGMIIEKVSGQRYEDYLDEQVLAPLKMRQSTFHFVHQEHDAELGLATGYFDGGQKALAQPMYLRPAGQFTTTANDMAKFARFLISGATLDGQSFIPANLLESLSKPTTTSAAKAGLEIGHGLALALRDRHGVVGQCHPGTTFGFQANICLFPDHNSAFFFAINTDSESANYEEFTIRLIEALNLPSSAAHDSAPMAKHTDHSTIEGFYLLRPANMEEFAWLDLVFNFQHLSWDVDRLVVRSLQHPEKLLIPITQSLFRASDRSMPSHVIIQSDNFIQFSDGLNTYTRSSSITLLLNWLSLALGLLGILYIVSLGAVRIAFRNVKDQGQILWPFSAILLFILPILAFQQQSFMQFGELTLASGLLTAVSLALPVTLIIAIALISRRQEISQAAKRDRLAMLAALQFCLLLGYWNLLPIKFWVVA